MELQKYEVKLVLYPKQLIRPVIRIVGSKYKMLPWLLEHFNLENINNKITTFLEPFGGSGIVSVNIKHLYSNIKVYLNDFDNIFPLTKEYIKDNNSRFNGYGTITKLAIKQYKTKIKNGLWDKVEKYNDVLSKIQIDSNDYLSFCLKILETIKNYKEVFIYFDPPYYNEKSKYSKFYKNSLNLNKFINDIKNINENYDVNIAISFRDCYEIREAFATKHWNIYEYEKINYHMSKFGKCPIVKELLITNYK